MLGQVTRMLHRPAAQLGCHLVTTPAGKPIGSQERRAAQELRNVLPMRLTTSMATSKKQMPTQGLESLPNTAISEGSIAATT